MYIVRILSDGRFGLSFRTVTSLPPIEGPSPMSPIHSLSQTTLRQQSLPTPHCLLFLFIDLLFIYISQGCNSNTFSMTLHPF